MADDDVAIARAGAPDVAVLAALVAAFARQLDGEAPRADSLVPALRRVLDDPGADFLLARDRTGRGLGYAQLRTRETVWERGPESELEDLFVIAPARRRGVGRRLLAAALERARARGARVIRVSTNERNAPALALYGQAGFAAERARWDGGRQLSLKRAL